MERGTLPRQNVSFDESKPFREPTMFHGEQLFFILLAILAGAWCLVGPVVWLVTLSRMKRIEREAESDRQRVRQVQQELVRLRSQPAAPPAAAGQAASLVERMEALRVAKTKPQVAPPVTAPEPLVDIWMEETPAKTKLVSREAELAVNLPTPPAEAGTPTTSVHESFSWEEILAGKWLTWVGAVAMVIGAGLFFKYTIDHDLIGPTGRVVIGVLVGMCTFAGGAYAMLRDYRFLSQGLVGAALGILYFSLFAAFKWIDPPVLSQPFAFVGMVLVTTAGLAFSGYFNTQATAILGLIGGFLTPIMLSQNQDAQVMLFSYILILDFGVLGLAGFRKWPAVQILAFIATAMMWLGWFGRWYDPSKLMTTVMLMTAFFLLFALIAVWYNVLRRKPADPGDFFLILATPVLYFAGLYGVTSEKYFYLHGLMALGLAGIYLGLGVLSLSRNPAGKSVVVSLAGIAASFLTIAVPLQLTGHWIAIAWAMESLLLVELGLRFGQPKLRYTGFGLLVVVQVILLQYVGETLDNPGRFDTRFTHSQVDPITQANLPTVNMTPADAMTPATATPPYVEPTPAWTDIFNGRSLSFLASAIVFGVLAWEYRKRSTFAGANAAWQGAIDSEHPAAPSPTSSSATFLHGWLLAAVPITVLGMLLIESFAAGMVRHWNILSMFGTFEVWIAAVAFVLVWLSATCGPRWLDKVGLGVFVLLALFLVGSSLTTLDQWRGMWSRLEESPGAWSMFLFNPRGMGFVAALVASAAAFVVYQRGTTAAVPSEQATTGLPSSPVGDIAGVTVTMLLGVFTFLTLLALLTVETYAQGVIHNWRTATALSITGVWAVYALVALVLGIMSRSASLRVMALSLLVLTTGKVFFYDVWHLSREIRTVAFVGLGVALFSTSFLYRRFRGRIREWMAPVLLAVLVPTAMMAGPTAASADEPAASSKDTSPIHQLSHRWPVDTKSLSGTGASAPKDEVVKFAIPPDLFGRARMDLADLRLFARPDGAIPSARPLEIPYVLIWPLDTLRAVQRQVTLLNLSERAGHTEFLLDLGDAADTINEVTIDVDAGDRNYARSVQVFGADRRDAEEWNLVQKSGYVLDHSLPGNQLRVGRVGFPQNRFHFYKVSINNQDQPPLRIAGASVSYREQVIVPRREFEGKIVSQEQDAEHKLSRIVIDLGHEKLPTLGLRLAVGYDGSFYRPVLVDVTNEMPGEKTAWRSVVSGHVYRIDRPDLQAASTELSYAETPGRFVRLTILNGDDRPVEVVSGIALAVDKYVAAERRTLTGDAPLSVALYAGNERLSAPTYDLSRTLGNVSAEKIFELKLSPSESNPEFKRPVPPWSEQNKSLLLTVTLGGVVVLGLLTAWLLMKAAKHGPTR
jgi:hypothetical protein